MLRSSNLQTLAIFQRKCLRGILGLSKTSSIPALHFLLGELPIEAQYHMDIFSLFYSIWINPDSQINRVVKFILQSSKPNSRTWSIFIRHLCMKYELPDPLESLESDPSKKSQYKELIKTKIIAFHEKQLREQASANSKMTYLNVSLTSIRRGCHPVISNVVSTHEVKKSRSHLKMLSGDYFTYSIKAKQSGGSPCCRLCPSELDKAEDIEYIITSCTAYKEIRNRILIEYQEILKKHKNPLLPHTYSDQVLCQFILDPSSINLHQRISSNSQLFTDLIKISRDFCFAIHSRRIKLLKSMQLK